MNVLAWVLIALTLWHSLGMMVLAMVYPGYPKCIWALRGPYGLGLLVPDFWPFVLYHVYYRKDL